MREYTVERKDHGKRLDRWLQAAAPSLTRAGMQKAFRSKTVRLNGEHAAGDARVSEGDTIRLYLPDDVFEQPQVSKEERFLRDFRVHLHILYEDENILLADKKPGLMSHPDDTEQINTLVTHIRAYLFQKGEYDPKMLDAFSPALCNRIDRFTGGIVIAAKNETALKEMNARIASREVNKYYLCAVYGALVPQEGMLRGYIYKPEGSRSVRVLEKPVTGAQEALTRYRTLAGHMGLTLVECELMTGRTHQIRAQMAQAGHPLLGDTQYGSRQDDRFEQGYQALYAYKVEFDFEDGEGPLGYLSGKSFSVGRVAFADRLFPGFDISAVRQ